METTTEQQNPFAVDETRAAFAARTDAVIAGSWLFTVRPELAEPFKDLVTLLAQFRGDDDDTAAANAAELTALIEEGRQEPLDRLAKANAAYRKGVYAEFDAATEGLASPGDPDGWKPSPAAQERFDAALAAYRATY